MILFRFLKWIARYLRTFFPNVCLARHLTKTILNFLRVSMRCFIANHHRLYQMTVGVFPCTTFIHTLMYRVTFLLQN